METQHSLSQAHDTIEKLQDSSRREQLAIEEERGASKQLIEELTKEVRELREKVKFKFANISSKLKKCVSLREGSKKITSQIFSEIK